MLLEPQNTQELDKILNEHKDGTYVLYFTAVWCGPCRAIGPVIEELSKSKPITFIKIDIDKCSEQSEVSKVSSVPHFSFYKNGSKTNEFTGASAAKLKESVEQLMK